MVDPVRMTANGIKNGYYDGEIDTDDEFVDAPSYDALAASLEESRFARDTLDYHILKQDRRIADLEAALILLTNGFKYSTEVVTIARNALSSCQPGYMEEQRGGATIRHSVSETPISVSTTGTVRRSVRDMVLPRSRCVHGIAMSDPCPQCSERETTDGVPCPNCGHQYRDHTVIGGGKEYFFRIDCPQAETKGKCDCGAKGKAVHDPECASRYSANCNQAETGTRFVRPEPAAPMPRGSLPNSLGVSTETGDDTMVKRYNPHSEIDISASCIEDSMGCYVFAADYDALAAETTAYVDKLVAERHKFEEALQAL